MRGRAALPRIKLYIAASCISVAFLANEADAANPVADMQKIMKAPAPKQVKYDDFVGLGTSQCSCNRTTKGCLDTWDLGQTIVTMLVAINRPGKSWGHYMKNLKRLMHWFPHTPLIAYIEEDYEKELADAHPLGASAPNLCVIPITVKELPEYSHIKEYASDLFSTFKTDHIMRFPESLLPVYDALTNSKFALMHRSVASNPFASKRWAWVDGGLHWPMDVSLPYIDHNVEIEGDCLYQKVCEFDDRKLNIQECGENGNSVCIGFNHPVACKLEEWKAWIGGTSREAKLRTMRDCWNCQDGATFTGSSKAMVRMAEAAQEVLKEYHEQHIVDADQGVQMQMFLNTDVVEDVKCKTFKFCTGFMLGAWNRSDKEKLMWQESDCHVKDEIDNVKTAMQDAEDQEADVRRLVVI